MCKDIVIDHYYCFISDLLSVSLVAQELTAVSEKWQDIREELGVKQSSLRFIRTSYSDPGDCLREVLSKQLGSCATSWKDIIAVLRASHIGESLLADHLEGKYCPSELANLHCSTSNAVEGCLPIHWCVCVKRLNCNVLARVSVANSFLHIVMFLFRGGLLHMWCVYSWLCA